jgi:hypothetical protein
MNIRPLFYLVSVMAMAMAVPAVAQYPTNMNNYIVAGTSNVIFDDNSDCTTFLGITLSCSERSSVLMEIPPWTIGGGWHTYILHNGATTSTYSSPNDMISNGYINLQGLGPYAAVGPDASKPWKRNYSGIYSAHYLTHPTVGTINLGFCHDENKNICGGPGNTIDPSIKTDCSNSYQGYFAMVSAVWTPNVQSNNWGQQGYNNDLGPILWPSVGYVTQNNAAATQGLLQPSSIVSGGYVYVFIWDKGPLDPNLQGQEGLVRGIKLVRAPIAGCLDPTQYQVYYKDPSGNVEWLPSLPAGFTKENMLQYVGIPGPKATGILSDEVPGNTESFRFTAAQVNGQNYFIGCEEYVDNNDIVNGLARHHVALRFSYDLMNWSPREMIIETSGNWNASNFNYPIFLSADGWTNTAIDLNNFYVLGVHSQSPFPRAVNKMNIQFYVPPPPPPPPPPSPPPCGTVAPASTGGVVANKSPCLVQVAEAVRDSSVVFDGNSIQSPSVYPFSIFPNPVNGGFTVQYFHPVAGRIKALLCDDVGRVIKTIVYGNEPAGGIIKFIDISSFGPGIYFLKLMDNGNIRTAKIFKQ